MCYKRGAQINVDYQDLNLSFFNKTKEMVGIGGNLRRSESISVLLRIEMRIPRVYNGI